MVGWTSAVDRSWASERLGIVESVHDGCSGYRDNIPLETNEAVEGAVRVVRKNPPSSVVVDPRTWDILESLDPDILQIDDQTHIIERVGSLWVGSGIARAFLVWSRSHRHLGRDRRLRRRHSGIHDNFCPVPTCSNPIGTVGSCRIDNSCTSIGLVGRPDV